MNNLNRKADSKMGKTGSATGNISDIDKDKGEVTLRSQSGETMTIHAHPAEVGSLEEGQMVTVQFQNIGDQMWSVSIAPSPKGAGEGV